MRRCGIVLFLLLVAAAPPAQAMFRAADLVVIPAAASISGLNSSQWRTDVEIMNVDTVAVDVEVVFLECCGTDNAVWFDTITNHLGGRKEEGFGYINDSLKDIQPNRAVTISDIITPNWGAEQKGALLFFAYEAGSLLKTTPPGGNPKRILVNARTYSVGTDASGNAVTYGQHIPGMPWYDYIDPQQKSKGLDSVLFSGIREDTAFRTDLGLVNLSDRLTSLDVTLTLFAADGTQMDQQALILPPLSHVQYDQVANTLFSVASGTPLVDATLQVAVTSYSTVAQDPTPGLIVYVSRIDNVSNDPIHIEHTFTKELPWDCVFNGNCTSTAGLTLNYAPHRHPALRAPAPGMQRLTSVLRALSPVR
jgi:hypothetical protein